MSYQDSVAFEVKIYENRLDVHDLPSIFHYWSERHLRPKFEQFGLSSPTDLFAKHLTGSTFLSIGAGNCDLEIQLASRLQGTQSIDCFDLNPSMLERGRQAAEQAGVSQHLNFIAGDINTWRAEKTYDTVLANQFLHHVVNLEGLFDQIRQSLAPGGKFLISDMIGRNGHLRWPEALSIVHEFWRQLPPSYRFNSSAGNYEEFYQNWDCSTQGFEGVRSQDILPLLIERFHFHLFLPYGNLIDPFIDRIFGCHFDASAAWDRNFIDAVHARDEEEIASGRITPTHMVAVLSNQKSETGQVAPEFYVRDPRKIVVSVPPSSPYDWSWPHDPETELKIACAHLSESGNDIKARTEWALSLNQRLEDRTAWAISRDKDVAAYTQKVSELEKNLAERTAWAQKLDAEMTPALELAKRLQHKIDSLEQQIEERTNWALALDEQLKIQTDRAEYAEAHPLKSLKHRLLQSRD